MSYRENVQAFDPDMDRRIDLLHYRRELIISQMVEELEAADLEQEFEALYQIWVTPTENLVSDPNGMGANKEESSVKALAKWLRDIDESLAQRLLTYEKLSHELADAEAPYTKVLQELATQPRTSRHEPGQQNRSMDWRRKSIEDMLDKHEELTHQICLEELEKEGLQHDIRVITDKLTKVNESLAQKIYVRDTLKRTLAECEAAYTKVLETSQALLTILKLEAGNVGKAT